MLCCQIQKANQEENLNREANEAAIAALGGTRGTKRTFGGDTLKANAQTNQGIQVIILFIIYVLIECRMRSHSHSERLHLT